MAGGRAAGPGGAESTGIKKRRLSALDERFNKRQKRERVLNPKEVFKSKPPSRHDTRLRTRAPPQSDIYGKLQEARCSDPVGTALKFPARLAAGHPHQLQKTLLGIALTDKDMHREKALRNLESGFGAKSFLTLKAERRSRMIVAKTDDTPVLGLLSNRKRKALGIDPLQQHYTPEMLDELNSVWQQSVHSTMQKDGRISMDVVLDMDLHGCNAIVKDCRNPQCHGIEGTIVKISRTCVHLGVKRTRKAQEASEVETYVVLKAVPKSGSTFSFEIPAGTAHAKLVCISGSKMQ